MSDPGLIEGEVCDRGGCLGKMVIVDSDGGCSCHISPPCAYCVDAEFECDTCETLAEKPETTTKGYDRSPWLLTERKSDHERFAELSGEKIEWIDITPANNYYFRVKRGKYPAGTTVGQIKDCFNLCFGYSYLNMYEGVFKIKYYTD
jgi:hypothetical protein